MSQLNPITGSILQSTQAELQQATERTREVREAQERAKNTTALVREDEVDIPIENSGEVDEIHDESHSSDNRRGKKRKHQDEQTPGDELDHLDLKA